MYFPVPGVKRTTKVHSPIGSMKLGCHNLKIKQVLKPSNSPNTSENQTLKAKLNDSSLCCIHKGPGAHHLEMYYCMPQTAIEVTLFVFACGRIGSTTILRAQTVVMQKRAWAMPCPSSSTLPKKSTGGK
jgi:hypothetical protein